MSGAILIGFGGLLILAGLAAVYAISRHQELKSAPERGAVAWQLVEIQLARRHQLVPQLVVTVAAYARRDLAVVQRTIVVRERAAGLAGSPPTTDRATTEAELTTTLDSLLAAAHRDRALAADPKFCTLERDLDATSRALSEAVTSYDDLVARHNRLVGRFPSRLLARRAQIEALTPFTSLTSLTGPSPKSHTVSGPVAKVAPGRGPRRAAD